MLEERGGAMEGDRPAPGATDTFWVRYRVPLLLGLGLLIYVPWLGLRDLWYPDEPDIGQVCKAMFQSGDWIAPRRNGVIWVDYPPLIYWVGTIASHLLGGMSAFALRLPNALTAVATGLVTCEVGSRWFGPRAGLWAGVVLLTAQQYVYEGVSYRPDVTFTLAIAAGTLVYAAGAGDRPRWYLRVAGFALLGVAMLAKGPLGLLLPGLVLTLWHVARREWRRWFELAPLALVSLAVYMPWFAACGRAMGADNILYELYAQNFARFTGGARGHEQPIWYYAVQVWVDLLPWAPLLPFAIVWLWRSAARRDRNVQLLLWWCGTFFVFLSIATTKRQLYLLPAYPALALLLAPWLDAVTDRARPPATRPSERPARVWTIVAAVLFGTLGVVLIAAAIGVAALMARLDLSPLERAVVPALRAPLAAAGLVWVVGAAWLAVAWRRRDARAGLVRLGAMQVAFYLVLMGWLLPAMNPVRSYADAGRWIRAEIGDATRIGLVNPHRVKGVAKMGAFGFYTDTLVDVIDGPDGVDDFFRRHPGSLVMVEREALDKVYPPGDPARHPRIVREMEITGDSYLAVGAPPGVAPGG